tara:strand:- start:41 stop:289 length:249 start_codon:yes stop_codon:yes gene_type:complete
MALTERVEIGMREVLADGQIRVRTDTVIERDGVEISRTYHRHVVVPGQDVSGEHADVQRVATAEHTAEVIAAYVAAEEAARA